MDMETSDKNAYVSIIQEKGGCVVFFEAITKRL
jgi:hypothetical protein